MYIYICVCVYMYTGAKAATIFWNRAEARERERGSKSQSPFCGHGTKSLVHATRSSKRNTFLLSTKFAHIIMQKLSTDYKQSFYETEPRTGNVESVTGSPGLLAAVASPYRWIFKRISFETMKFLKFTNPSKIYLSKLASLFEFLD